MIRVTVVAHEVDCLPGHVEIRGHGSGGSLRVAMSRAVQDVAVDPQLRGRRPRSLKLNVLVFRDNVKAEQS